jgi:hypothetical protein
MHFIWQNLDWDNRQVSIYNYDDPRDHTD